MQATYEDVLRDTYHKHDPILNLLNISSEQVADLFAEMTDSEKDEFEALLRTTPARNLMPHQIVPDPFAKDRWWEVMLGVGGRGTAKTTTGAFAVREHLRHFKKKARVGIGAPTSADARDVCAEGETGLYTMFPSEFVKYNRSLGEARHIDGGYVKFMGTEKPKRWNGPQWSMIWFDELALCNQAAWDDAMLGLRIPGPNGEEPYALATTTPKNRRFVKDLAQQPTTYVPQYIDQDTGKRRLPTTFDNPYLPQRRVDWLRNKYGGTRMGRQELLGQFLDDVQGAQIKRDWFIHETDPRRWPEMVKTVVAVDPAGSVAREKADENALSEEQRQNKEKNADTGIAVVGVGVDGRLYVMALKSGQWTPTEWGAEAVRLFHLYRCSHIVCEQNFGGLMVSSTIQNVNVFDTVLRRQLVGRMLPIKLVVASKGKHIRLQPVAALYEQNTLSPRIIHCNYFWAGEDQMCAFVSADENEGADMVDSLVWACAELMGIVDRISNSIIVRPSNAQIAAFQAQQRRLNG